MKIISQIPVHELMSKEAAFTSEQVGGVCTPPREEGIIPRDKSADIAQGMFSQIGIWIPARIIRSRIHKTGKTSIFLPNEQL